MIGKMKYRMNTERRSSRKAADPGRGAKEDAPQSRVRAGAALLKSGTDAVQSKARAGASLLRTKTDAVWPKKARGDGASDRSREEHGRRPGSKDAAGMPKDRNGRAASKSRENDVRSGYGNRERPEYETDAVRSGYERDGRKQPKHAADTEWSRRREGGAGKSGHGADAEWSRRREGGAGKSGHRADAEWSRRREGGAGKSGHGADAEWSGYGEAGTGKSGYRADAERSGYGSGAVQPEYETDTVQLRTEEDAALPKIEGRNAVLEAFRAGKTIDKLFVLDGCKDGPVRTIVNEAKKHDTVIHFVDKDRLNKMSETKKHQGVIAVSAAYEYASIEDILAKAEEKGEDPFLILLDNIEDPHNLGAIIRTANLAGVHGIIIPKRRAVGLTGTVAKASAGAVSYTPVAKVTNLSQTIRELKERGIWFVCADMEGETMYRQNLTGPVGLVIGGEGGGVSRLVKENCDFTAAIPMKGEIGSLNASAAAAVLAYEIVRQRGL